MLRRSVAALIVLGAFPAHGQTAKIVGLGASTCARFNQETSGNLALQRDYFAWAQGFMSGALIRAPEGVDEDLDLTPPSMPLQTQAGFLRAFCEKNPEQDYMEAVRALYHRLRGPGT